MSLRAIPSFAFGLVLCVVLGCGKKEDKKDDYKEPEDTKKKAYGDSLALQIDVLKIIEKVDDKKSAEEAVKELQNMQKRAEAIGARFKKFKLTELKEEEQKELDNEFKAEVKELTENEGKAKEKLKKFKEVDDAVKKLTQAAAGK